MASTPGIFASAPDPERDPGAGPEDQPTGAPPALPAHVDVPAPEPHPGPRRETRILTDDEAKEWRREQVDRWGRSSRLDPRPTEREYGRDGSLGLLLEDGLVRRPPLGAPPEVMEKIWVRNAELLNADRFADARAKYILLEGKLGDVEYHLELAREPEQAAWDRAFGQRSGSLRRAKARLKLELALLDRALHNKLLFGDVPPWDAFYLRGWPELLSLPELRVLRGLEKVADRAARNLGLRLQDIERGSRNLTRLAHAIGGTLEARAPEGSFIKKVAAETPSSRSTGKRPTPVRVRNVLREMKRPPDMLGTGPLYDVTLEFPERIVPLLEALVRLLDQSPGYAAALDP